MGGGSTPPKTHIHVIYVFLKVDILCKASIILKFKIIGFFSAVSRKGKLKLFDDTFTEL